MNIHYNSEIEANPSTILSVQDNLELSNVTVPDIPKDVIFPDDLNRYLRNQVQSLAHENGMLRKNLSDNEMKLTESVTKLDKLNLQLQQQSATTTCSLDTNVAGAKIIELSKKLRERNSEIEVYKTKCSKLQHHILKLEENAKAKEVETIQKPKIVKTDEADDEAGNETKLLQEKLNAANGKICELRNNNSKLKNDLKLANKMLHQEVGDSFESIHAFNTTNNSNNWRGRAQQICDLQQKLNDLKEKLKEGKQLNSKPITSQTGQAKFEIKLQALQVENVQLKETLEQTKKKFENCKARVRVAESELSLLRMKLTTAVEDKDANQKLIATLNTQINSQREHSQEQMKQKQNNLQRLEQENKKLQLSLAQELCKTENLSAQLDAKTDELSKLKSKHPMTNAIASPKWNQPTADVLERNRLEAERLRLLELTEMANHRLEMERRNHAETLSKYQTERQKAVKLEARLARLQLEQQSDRQYSVYSTCFSEQSKGGDNPIEDQLELARETIKTLETKLQLEQQERRIDFKHFTQILNNNNNNNK